MPWYRNARPDTYGSDNVLRIGFDTCAKIDETDERGMSLPLGALSSKKVAQSSQRWPLSRTNKGRDA